jgi:hypothetical protein
VQARLTPNLPSQWEVHLGVDPIPLQIAVGCRKQGPPSLVVVGPTWARIDLGTRELDPAICHPKPAGRGFFGTLKEIGKLAAVGTLGYLVGHR